MRFSRQEYWSWLPCSPPENLPDPEIEPASVSCVDGLVLYHYCSLQSPYQRDASACKVTTCIASALFIDWMQFPEAFWDQLSSAETLIVSWFQSLQNKILQTHKAKSCWHMQSLFDFTEWSDCCNLEMDIMLRFERKQQNSVKQLSFN